MKDLAIKHSASNLRLFGSVARKDFSENIAEAAKELSDEIKDQAKNIPWLNISDMRHVLIYQYFKFNSELVEGVVNNKLPELKQAVRSLLD